MLNNYSSKQVGFIQTALKSSLTVPYAYAAWYELVQYGGKWDHKNAINDELPLGKQTPFTGTRADWFAHTPKATGPYCPAPDGWYNYDIWSNIHYGFIGLRAGFSEGILLDAAGAAQKGLSVSSFVQSVGDGSILNMRKNDTAPDQAAIGLGFYLYKTYGNAFTLDQFRVETLKWTGLNNTTVLPK